MNFRVMVSQKEKKKDSGEEYVYKVRDVKSEKKKQKQNCWLYSEQKKTLQCQ